MSHNSLIEIDKNITVIYESLNDLADSKTQVLKENDIKTLDSIIRKEDQLNKKIMKLLQTRSELVTDYDEFSDLQKKEIQQQLDKLKKTSSEFAKKNELNQSLVQQSLYYVNMNLSLLSPQGESDTYSPQNKKISRKPTRVFMDSRV